MGVECVSRTHVGLRRKVNEDALLSRPARGLWAVADGMGGHEAGEVASAMIVNALGHCPAHDEIDAAARWAEQALGAVHDELVAFARSGDRPRVIGSTVVGLILEDAQFRCFWAGDSRALRLRDGALVQLTRDHSLVQQLVDGGLIAPEEAEAHPQANVVTRAVGVGPALAVETVGGAVAPGDRFLLASDGLTRLVGTDELAGAMGEPSLDAIADRLIDTVLARGAPDNVSLILIAVER